MEKTIKLEIPHKHHETKIEVDNSTEFKEFNIEITISGRIHRLFVKSFTEDGVKVLEMDNIKLRGREAEMFVEFLNQ
jgi:hypothetical protein